MNKELASLGYIIKDGKYLMLLRNKKANDNSKDKWVGIGGKIEHNESPDDALVREIKEETGLDVVSFNLKGIVTYPDFYPNVTSYMHIYEVTEVAGDLLECDEGKLEWISEDKLKDLNMWEGDRLILEWMKKSFFTAKISYKEGDMYLESVKFND